MLQALQSVSAQTYRSYEVVVVDDGSSDETRTAVAGLDGAIRYLYQRKAGEACARNRGLSAARGELVAFLDSDDQWEPEFLETEVGILRHHPEIALACAGAITAGKKSQRLASRQPLVTGDLFPLLFRSNFVNNSTVLARARCLEQSGGFNETYPTYYDYDLWLRIARGHALAYVNRCLVRCGRQGDNLSKDITRSREPILEILRQNYDPARIDASVYRRRLSDCCVTVGRALVDQGEYARAWNVFFKARELTPYRHRPYRYMIKTLVRSLRSARRP